jgi:hypothetical protein
VSPEGEAAKLEHVAIVEPNLAHGLAVDANAGSTAAIAKQEPLRGADNDTMDFGNLRGSESQVATAPRADQEQIAIQKTMAIQGGPVGNDEGGLRGIERFGGFTIHEISSSRSPESAPALS